MNYGFAHEGDGALGPDDEPERYCAQLYRVVASQADLAGRRVLDVGSGRGGGAAHIHRDLRPAETVGCDQTGQVVAFCDRVHAGTAGLRFCRGDAMRLPFEDATFDAVLNVESAHCYAERPRFFDEVMRVLAPGGDLLFADFTSAGGDAEHERQQLLIEIERAGLELLDVTDITRNIVLGLDRDSERRAGVIDRYFPIGLRRAGKLWAGTRDSWIYRDFAEGRRKYLMCRAVKPSTATQPASRQDHLISTSTKLMGMEPALTTLCSTPASRR
ncbi:MAG: class I SAM-dependent methyltransferase [Paracoccaceae bacterium]